MEYDFRKMHGFDNWVSIHKLHPEWSDLEMFNWIIGEKMDDNRCMTCKWRTVFTGDDAGCCVGCCHPSEDAIIFSDREKFDCPLWAQRDTENLQN